MFSFSESLAHACFHTGPMAGYIMFQMCSVTHLHILGWVEGCSPSAGLAHAVMEGTADYHAIYGLNIPLLYFISLLLFIPVQRPRAICLLPSCLSHNIKIQSSTYTMRFKFPTLINSFAEGQTLPHRLTAVEIRL